MLAIVKYKGVFMWLCNSMVCVIHMHASTCFVVAFDFPCAHEYAWRNKTSVCDVLVCAVTYYYASNQNYGYAHQNSQGDKTSGSPIQRIFLPAILNISRSSKFEKSNWCCWPNSISVHSSGNTGSQKRRTHADDMCHNLHGSCKLKPKLYCQKSVYCNGTPVTDTS